MIQSWLNYIWCCLFTRVIHVGISEQPCDSIYLPSYAHGRSSLNAIIAGHVAWLGEDTGRHGLFVEAHGAIDLLALCGTMWKGPDRDGARDCGCWMVGKMWRQRKERKACGERKEWLIDRWKDHPSITRRRPRGPMNGELVGGSHPREARPHPSPVGPTKHDPVSIRIWNSGDGVIYFCLFVEGVAWSQLSYPMLCLFLWRWQIPTWLEEDSHVNLWH